MSDMAFFIRRGASLALGGLLAAGCGNGDDLDPAASTLPEAPVEVRPAPPPEVVPDEEPDDVEPPIGAGGTGQGPEEEEELGDPDACRTPNGVSGSPRTLEQAIILMNSLPRPTTLACFVQALERPLSVYMTSSSFSLQPAPGARSPRIFIVNEPLVMSIVLDGPAAAALEFGLRTSAIRSIKTEMIFPLTTDVNYDNFFSEVAQGPDSTKCSACHTGEVVTLSEALPIEVFESDIIRPFEGMEVDVPSLRAEHTSCNEAEEPERCLLLSAFFDYGDVVAAPNGFMFGAGVLEAPQLNR
jgi:hypothetical protein